MSTKLESHVVWRILFVVCLLFWGAVGLAAAHLFQWMSGV